jgi:VIT1/CCC1 family predicted Fe2+/Mn2+ transporter
MIIYEAATTGTSTAQIIDQRNASSGMWAFSEGLEVLFLVILFYLLWPIVLTQ